MPGYNILSIRFVRILAQTHLLSIELPSEDCRRLIIVDINITIDIHRQQTRAIGFLYVCLISYNRLKMYVNHRFYMYMNEFFMDRISQPNDLSLFHFQCWHSFPFNTWTLIICALSISTCSYKGLKKRSYAEITCLL